MSNKELLKDLCERLQARLALTSQGNRISFFSGIKTSRYWLPQIKIGTSLPMVDKAWFVEISVDDVVVFRESMTPVKGVNIEDLESKVIDKTLRSVFFNGVMLAKNQIDINKKQ